MNRWIALSLALLAPVAVHAQLVRTAPADVKPARLVVTAPPEIRLNGQPERLSPGARIRNTQNMMVLSGSIAGQEHPVVYRRDGVGNVHEVWLLTEDEYARLGGTDAGSPDGHVRFMELLNIIFGARR